MEEKELYQEEVAQDPSKVKGLVALIAGITSFFFTGFAGSIVAIVFGGLSKDTAGAKMGKIGRALGIVNLILWALCVVIAIALFGLEIFALLSLSGM